jgi:uncharacterized SAM-binding protein YcdF (DUF218 family)
MNKVDLQAKIIFDYMRLRQNLQKSNAIFVLGSQDLRSANFACDLYLKGYAPLIIFSGDSGGKRIFDKTEAETFRDIALERGVPTDSILIENKSKSSGHNIEFTKKLVEDKKLKIKSVIVIQKPHTERRIYAAMKKRWPDLSFTIASYKTSFSDYLKKHPNYSREEVINRLVGEFQRIVEYPKLVFQIEQPITPEATKAFNFLVKGGFNNKLIKKS